MCVCGGGGGGGDRGVGREGSLNEETWRQL